MLLHIIVFCIFSTLVGVRAVEENYTLFTKNNLTFRVKQKGLYYIQDENIPILATNAVSDISDMEALLLYNDQIEEIQPGAFQNLPSLIHLEIYVNKVEKILAGVFNSLTNLYRLDLNVNKISHIDPHAFDGLEKLNYLNLANNKLTRWDVNWFAKSMPLRHTYVSHNLLEEIPANAFGSRKEPTGDNAVSIFLQGNKIKRIDKEAFANLKKIQVLSLTNNEIGTLNGDFLSNLQIGELYLSANKLQCLAQQDFEKIFVATFTHMVYNPWNATCLEVIKQWTQTHQKNVYLD